MTKCFCLALLASLLACRGKPADGTAPLSADGSASASVPSARSVDIAPPSTRDSANVTIVETKVPVWGDEARWTVDPNPTLSIGETESEAPYLFSRIMGAIRADDGSIIVADGATRELRKFDSKGHFLLTKGRRGQGPAEFSMIERIARCGENEIWVNAWTRISIWSLKLDYIREFKVTDNIMWPLICFGGGGLLVKEDVGDMVEEPVNTIFSTALKLRAVDSLGASRRDLLQIPLWDYINVPFKGTIQGLRPPFSHVTLLAPDGPNLMIGFGQHLEVNTYSRNGTLLRIARGPNEQLAMTTDMRRDYQTVELSRREKQDREVLEAAGFPMPKTIPAYSALIVDREGNAWVKRFSPPGHPADRWGIFSSDGQFLGHTTLPLGLEVYEIGGDYLLGKTMDSLGVERVREYRIRK